MSSTNKPPGPLHDFELHKFISVHFQGIIVPSTENPVPPGVESEGIIAPPHQHKQGEHPTGQAVGLTQTSPADGAVLAVFDDDVTLSKDAQDETEAEVHDEEEEVLFRLLPVEPDLYLK